MTSYTEPLTDPYFSDVMTSQIIAVGISNLEIEVLADSSSGTLFGSPNDLALDRHGGIYFTSSRTGRRGGGQFPGGGSGGGDLPSGPSVDPGGQLPGGGRQPPPRRRRRRITFADTGSGIPADARDRIFDPGFTTKGVGVGVGLGLSTAYRIVQKHGGRIDVNSEEGKGSTFTLTLPIVAKGETDG